MYYRHLPGQPIPSQVLFSLIAPEHSDPPSVGLGFEHDLTLVICPLPHVTLQPDHNDHGDHWPSTVKTLETETELYLFLSID